MSAYIVEVSVPQDSARKRIADTVRATGSHFATKALWRRHGDSYAGTLVVNAADEIEARLVVPPVLRGSASVRAVVALAA